MNVKSHEGDTAEQSDRYYLCVTCGELKQEAGFPEHDCTCTECIEKGNHDVNYREAPDGVGFIKTSGNDGVSDE